LTGPLVGSAVGFLAGLFGFIAIRRLADRIQAARADDAGQRTASLLRSTAVIDLVLFTAGGALAGWYVFPSG
jgi:hypothetical protein